MKKNYWMLGMAIVALTSCTNDEVVEVNPSNVIQFESFVNKGTRAVTPTDANNFSQFYVFGYYDKSNNATQEVFDNVLVKRTASTTTVDGVDKNIWETQAGDAKNWTANVYHFGAYATKNESEKIEDLYDANQTLTSGVKFENGTLKFTGYTIDNTANDDLVAAVPTSVDNTSLANPYVGLTFKHMLSQVKFTFTNNHTDNPSYKMAVSDITFSVKKTSDCTYDGTNITWGELEGSVSEVEFIGSTEMLAVGESYTSEAHLVIPQTLVADIKASFTITFYDSNDAVVDVLYYTGNNAVSLVGDGQNPAVDSWNPGFIYNYTANFPVSPQTIKFTTTVEEWKEESVNDTDVDKDVEF